MQGLVAKYCKVSKISLANMVNFVYFCIMRAGGGGGDYYPIDPLGY